MKRIFALFAALVLVGSVAFSAVVVNVTTPTTGTYEYFGIAKPIQVAGINYTLGINYQMNDRIVFELPDGFVWGNNPGWFMYTASGATSVQDHNGDGVPDISYFMGGNGARTVTFRVTDGLSQGIQAGRIWYVCSINAPAIATPAGNTTRIVVPARPASGLPPGAGRLWNLTSYAYTSFDLVNPFETANGLFFTTWYEYYLTGVVKAVNVIDVEQGRRGFVGPTFVSSATSGFVLNDWAAVYQVTPYVAPAPTALRAYFNYVAGGPGSDLSGVQTFAVNALTAAPVLGAATINDVPGPVGPAFSTATLQVNGIDALNQRVVPLTVNFLGEGAPNNYANREIGNVPDFWTWTTNGTVFRTAFFTTAVDVGDYSSFRLVNGYGAPADVYADVVLDDLQAAVFQKVGTIPANGKLSITAYDLCVAAGLTPARVYGVQGFKGRAILSVWAPRHSTYGIHVMIAPSIYTEVALEKEMPAGSAWWEK